MGDAVVEKTAAAPEEHPQKAIGWAARDASGHLSPFRFSRRATGESDVQLKILYCGICHSDLHNIKNDWGTTIFPVVPGHEIGGVEVPPFSLILGGKKLVGSCIGGMGDTQEMLDFAGKHGITADVEVIPMEYVNTAMERLAKNDIKYRFVIDVANTLKATE